MASLLARQTEAALARHGLAALAAGAGNSSVKSAARRETQRALTLSAELTRVAGALDRAGVEFVALKGPALSQILYGDPGFRASRDLDIAVRPADAGAAGEVLSSAGYEALPDAGDFEWFEERTWRNSTRGIHVDLHTALSPRWFPARLDLTRVLERRVSVEFGGMSVTTPDAEDHLIFLCMHGARHAWSSVGWMVDVAALLSRFPALDSGAVQRRAREARAERMLGLGLALARDLAGTGPGDAAFAPLAREILDRPFTENAPAFGPGSAEAVRLNWRLADSRFAAARYLAAVAAAPTVADLAWVRLPPKLRLLYYPLRAFRLASRFVMPGRR